MLTPQEVQEKTFVKAVFGGYDMSTVDDFIDVLSADYNTLYNENAVLKSKMNVLVEKLEEYRSQENSMKNALLAAQKTADELVASTQKKCARAVQDAEDAANERMKSYQEAEEAEKERVAQAQQETNRFIEQLQAQVSQTVQALEDLKTRVQDTPVQKERPKPYDYESEADGPAAIARTIEQNMVKLVGEEPKPAEAPEPAAEEASAAEAPEAEPEKTADEPEGPEVTDATQMMPPVPERPTLVSSESSRLKFSVDDLQFGTNLTKKD
mgnify:CR=1 FL=1